MYSPARTILIALLLLHLDWSYASQNQSIAIKDLTAEVLNDQVQVNCEVGYRLHDSVKEALNNGIEMTFRLEIELMQTNAYWLDKVNSRLKREFTVKYHALSKQFVMKDANSDVERSFPDLYSAFYYQRRLHNATFGNLDSEHVKSNYYLRARARLVSEDLPLPLRIKSYLSSNWRPTSGWTVWQI